MQISSVGLRLRLIAFVFDYILIVASLILLVVLAILLRNAAPSFFGSVFSSQYSAQMFGFITVTLPVSLYFAISEASSRQATWGKRRVKLKVIRMKDGKPLSLARSLGRTASKFVPWELSYACIWYIRFHPESSWPFVIGIVVVFILVGLNIIFLTMNLAHQTLYDMITGTAVEKVF